MASPPRIVLHQFAQSHYNEKARWALDWKGIPHRRRTHLPGPHALAMLRLAGQRTTPVLVIDGEVIAGSAAILAALDVGDGFSLADLACAALLAPLVSPDHPDMRAPSPRPAALEAFHARFASHAGAAWVREQYRKHRPPSRALDD